MQRAQLRNRVWLSGTNSQDHELSLTYLVPLELAAATSLSFSRWIACAGLRKGHTHRNRQSLGNQLPKHNPPMRNHADIIFMHSPDSPIRFRWLGWLNWLVFLGFLRLGLLGWEIEYRWHSVVR
jgi:hypothetical protein